MLAYPSQYGGVDCRVKVSAEVLQELRENLIAEVGTREESLAFLSPEIRIFIEGERERLQIPALSFSNAWDYFPVLAAGVSERFASLNILSF